MFWNASTFRRRWGARKNGIERDKIEAAEISGRAEPALRQQVERVSRGRGVGERVPDKQARGAETFLCRRRAEVERRSMHLKGAAACNAADIVVVQMNGNEEVHLGKQECPDGQLPVLAPDMFTLWQWLPLPAPRFRCWLRRSCCQIFV
jgi:hypothetical protein